MARLIAVIFHFISLSTQCLHSFILTRRSDRIEVTAGFADTIANAYVYSVVSRPSATFTTLLYIHVCQKITLLMTQVYAVDNLLKWDLFLDQTSSWFVTFKQRINGFCD